MSTKKTRLTPPTPTAAWDDKLVVFRTSWRPEYQSQIQILPFTAVQAYKDGVVGMSGTAASAEAMEKAVLMAGNVQGVSEVKAASLSAPPQFDSQFDSRN